MKPIPESMTAGPFSRAQARAAGVTDRMLNGRRFLRVFPSVFRHRGHVMTRDDWIEAARLALPEQARTTGITRIQQLGLDIGPSTPVRFVVEGELHLAIEGIFLHRTKRMPPTDGVGVTPAAAFIAYCRSARVIDAIKVGDWLLHHGHMTLGELHDLALAQQWRDGAVRHCGCSITSTETPDPCLSRRRGQLLDFAGLSAAAVNRSLRLSDDLMLIGDLVYEEWDTVVEYEGAHHQRERGQYVADIDRYATMRRHHIGYVQVTAERLAHPKTLVEEVHRELVEHGYDGPPPVCGRDWAQAVAAGDRRLGADGIATPAVAPARHADLKRCRRHRCPTPTRTSGGCCTVPRRTTVQQPPLTRRTGPGSVAG